MLVGVIAIQGDYETHQTALQDVGAETVQIRKSEDAGFANPNVPRTKIEAKSVRQYMKVKSPDALVVPGGESHTIDMLGRQYGIDSLLSAYAATGKLIFGTCAGAIWLGKGTHHKTEPLELIDVDLERNAYGRQRDSFIADIDVKGLENPFEAVFIRAPKITRIGDGVEVIAECNGDPVLVRKNNIWLATFHPERSENRDLHKLIFGLG